MDPVQAGIGRVRITPPIGTHLIGFAHVFYRLPAPVAPMAAGLIEETAVRLLRQVAEQGGG